MKSIIKRYIDYAIELEQINQVSLSQGINLRRNNKLADKLREIAKNIELETPKYKSAFAELLTNENQNVKLWCAHHMLEVMNYDDKDRKNALLVIKDYSINSYGEKIWLMDWFTNNPQDKLLL